MKRIAITICAGSTALTAVAGDWTVKDGKIPEIHYKGKLKTKVYADAKGKPALHPLVGPDEIHMTRAFPLEAVREGEKKDHPHHTGLWFTHGRVNGRDFWHGGHDVIRTDSQKVVADEAGATITSSHSWVAEGGRTECTDNRVIRLSGDDDELIVDYRITINAKDHDVLLGDTKEGTFAFRTHPRLRGKDMGATMVNSEGQKGKGIWGKKAKWVCYYNTIGGKVHGVTIMDKPGNLRHPTTWHARDYGLLTANPFGISKFLRQKGGDHTVRKGESLTFNYRVILHRGNPEEAGIEKIYEDWAEE